MTAPIIDWSMDVSVMPLCLKRFTVTSLLKISKLGKEDMKNYRRIPSLPFISELIEKLVARGVKEQLEHDDFHDSYQSAYRRGPSTEACSLESAHALIVMRFLMKDPGLH